MVQAVSCQALTTKARVHFQVSPCETCAVRSGTGTGLSASNKGSSLSLSFYQHSTHSFTHLAPTLYNFDIQRLHQILYLKMSDYVG
jgi:hypothetical protein